MRTFILAQVILLAACTSQTVESPHYYLLRSPAPITSAQINEPILYRLGRVKIATYINQPGLVLQKGSGEINVARHHEWAEPLGISLRQFLATEIGAAANTMIAVSDTRGEGTSIEVTIDQLHGNHRGEAILVAYWNIEPAGGIGSAHQFSESIPLARDGYGALVAAEQILLQQLGQRIGESL